MKRLLSIVVLLIGWAIPAQAQVNITIPASLTCSDGFAIVFSSGVPTCAATSGVGTVTNTTFTTGKIPKASGGAALVDSLLSESGSTVTVTGAMNATTDYKLNGTSVFATTNTWTVQQTMALAKVTGNVTGALAVAGDHYSHVLLAVGFQNTANPLEDPHQVGVYSAVIGNTYTGTGVTGAPATNGYVIGFETALETNAGGIVPWVVGYSVGSTTKASGDTIVRTAGITSIDDSVGTNNAFIAPFNSTFTGNWYIFYDGTRPSRLGEGALTVGNEIYRSASDDYLRFSGASSAGSGASLLLFGSSHASNANKAQLNGSGGVAITGPTTITGATGITGATTVTGAMTVTADTVLGEEVYRSAADSYMRVAGGTVAAGAHVVLFGESHGSAANKMQLNASAGISATGLVVGSPTGGYKGTGTVNATAVYDDNVLLSDWVFEDFYGSDRGVVVPIASAVKGPDRRLVSLEETRAVTQSEKRLPWMPTANEFETERNIGGMMTRLWVGQEQQQLYIFELESRIAALEKGRK